MTRWFREFCSVHQHLCTSSGRKWLKRSADKCTLFDLREMSCYRSSIIERALKYSCCGSGGQGKFLEYKWCLMIKKTLIWSSGYNFQLSPKTFPAVTSQSRRIPFVPTNQSCHSLENIQFHFWSYKLSSQESIGVAGQKWCRKPGGWSFIIQAVNTKN